MSPKTLWIAQTTVTNEQEATQLAHLVVARRLAACAQIDPKVRSIYRWKDKIESADEWRLTFKTPRTHLRRLRETVLKAHPYETPEWIAWPLSEVSSSYLAWAVEQVE